MEIVHIHGGLCAEIKHEGVVTPAAIHSLHVAASHQGCCRMIGMMPLFFEQTRPVRAVFSSVVMLAPPFGQ